MHASKIPSAITLASYLLYVVAVVHFFIILPYIVNKQLLQGLWIGAVLFHVIMLFWFPYQAAQIRKANKKARDKVIKMIIVTAIVGTFFVVVLAHGILYYMILLIVALILDGGILYLLLNKTSKNYFKNSHITQQE